MKRWAKRRGFIGKGLSWLWKTKLKTTIRCYSCLTFNPQRPTSHLQYLSVVKEGGIYFVFFSFFVTLPFCCQGHTQMLDRDGQTGPIADHHCQMQQFQDTCRGSSLHNQRGNPQDFVNPRACEWFQRNILSVELYGYLTPGLSNDFQDANLSCWIMNIIYINLRKSVELSKHFRAMKVLFNLNVQAFR